MSEMILPGVYIEVRPEGLISPGQVTISNLGVVGTAARGDPNKPILVSAYADAKQHFYEYDPWIDGNHNELTLVRALEQAFAFGASKVYAVRVTATANPANPASHTLKSKSGDCVVLMAASPGTWGNDLLVNVATADQNAFVEDEKHTGSPVTLKRTPIVKSALNSIQLGTRLLKILYGGGFPDDDPGPPGPGQVEVDRKTGDLHFGDTVGPADVVDGSYTVDKAKAAKVTLKLDQAQQIYTIADGNDLIQDINNDPLAWVKAAQVKGHEANADELPLAIPDSPFTGGGNAANASLADYQSGLDALLNQDAHIIVVVMSGQDENKVGARLEAHCALASTDALEHDRIAVVGTGTLADPAHPLNDPDIINDTYFNQLLAHSLNSDRVIFVGPGMQATDAATGIEVTLPGAYAAAAVAGLLASFSPHISLTNKELAVDDIEQHYDKPHLSQLVQARVLALEKRQGLRIVKGITTESGGAFSQITTRRIVDYAKYGTRLAAQPYIGLLNNERVRGALRATVNSFLAGMVDDEMLIGYELEVSATRDEEIKGIARVTMTLQPVFSIDFIKVTMFLQ